MTTHHSSQTSPSRHGGFSLHCSGGRHVTYTLVSERLDAVDCKRCQKRVVASALKAVGGIKR